MQNYNKNMYKDHKAKRDSKGQTISIDIQSKQSKEKQNNHNAKD